MPASASEPRGWWARYRSPAAPGSPALVTLTGVDSDEYPFGSDVEQPDDRRPPGWAVSVTRSDAGRVHRVLVNQPGVPLLWFVELDEPAADPPAATLLAFSDARHAHGEVLTAADAQAAGVRGDQQVAAVRWWTGSGLVHQLYVAPQHRRKGIATALVTAAFGVQAAHGRPLLHGDGRRTDDGEAWRAGLAAHLQHWFEPWSRRLPSMTPDPGSARDVG
ncbi:GNAT family N-acetyltransferase [Klenkia brasiliensis]|uniref:Acetyltransferase (GNAT) family protein n=1 Tax=Klenkia brasiliensis TaxID=333142 RepID=A0A1G7MQL4_9ACTN|nr:GNAT family N-acetyltransferase [Klenkia brasiliensis]SDF64014.1 Acetyltransferase (GNAT) family protein [Klenkia brasiliensis]